MGRYDLVGFSDLDIGGIDVCMSLALVWMVLIDLFEDRLLETAIYIL